MIRGSCLCGGVRFEIADASGPFELCHCSRCRKATGSAFLPGLRVQRAHVAFVQGLDLITTYEAPILEGPPAYKACFCSRCGSPVPDPDPNASSIDVAAGVLDDDPGLRPERHIFVECKAPWSFIEDGLPQLDRAAIGSLRQAQRRP
ncbi:GFA family protein [Pseudaquabacterium terrae]|nr:GFA family protein [Aquabacterium terrae]